MHPASVTAGPSAAFAPSAFPDDATLAHRRLDDAHRARCGSAADLAEALQHSRRDTLATFAAFEAALPGLQVPLDDTLNPPLWELGHIGWFQAWWLARNPARDQGWRADPDVPRLQAARGDADAWYDSSRVPHDLRWSLPLPDADTTRTELAAQLGDSLAGLARLQAAGRGRDGNEDGNDNALYFARLVLLHEDMHHEAALVAAQHLAVPIADARWQPMPLPDPPAPVQVAAGVWRQGESGEAGFAFDNELGAHDLGLGETRIDAQAVRWAEFLPFVEEGAYADDRCWSEPGCRWRDAAGLRAPRYLRHADGIWQQRRHGVWRVLDLREAACHLSAHEAQAYCRWAGRRLPTEAEWERAALCRPDAFRWGDVWEWTSSAFAPYPGFQPHPYRDYSAPWFDGRPVLRGASFMTQPRMRHARYRNFFPPGRNDLAAGLRCCTL